MFPPIPPGAPGYVVPGVGFGVIIDPQTGEWANMQRSYSHKKVREKQKERHIKVRVNGVFSAIWKAFGVATEGLDLLDVTYKSIPCDVKKKAGMMGRYIGPQDKAAFVAAHSDKINGREFTREYLKNQFEDWFYGMMGRSQAGFHQQLHAATTISHGAAINSQKYGNDVLFAKAQKKQFDAAWKKYTDAVERFRAARERDIKRKYGPKARKVYANKSDFKKAEIYKPGKQWFPGNPIVDQFNQWADNLFGAKAEQFGCCAGKRVRCGLRASQAKQAADRMRRK